MKKVLRLVFLIVLLGIVLSVAAFAAQPRWSSIGAISPEIDKGGNAYYCVISGGSGTTRIECTMILYEKNDLGQYIEVSKVSEVHNGSSKIFFGNYNMQSSKTYMLTVNAVVTCNGTKETATCSIVR